MAPLPGFFEGTETPAAGWWEALWPDPAQVLTAVGVTPEMAVVDLCAGDGWFTLHIARRARRVVAIDIDLGTPDVARLRLAEGGVTNCDYVAGDAYEVATLVPAPVDFVFLANAFHGVPDRPRLSRAVRASLFPGGRFAVVNWHRRPREETVILGEPRGPRTELRMTSNRRSRPSNWAGLKLSRLIELPPYHYAAIFQRAPFRAS